MHQWIGSLSHDLQGVIHRNMHLHLYLTLRSYARKKDGPTAWSGRCMLKKETPAGNATCLEKNSMEVATSLAAWLRNSRTPAGFKPKPARSIPLQNSLTSLSDALKKEKADATTSKETSAGHATGLESSSVEVCPFVRKKLRRGWFQNSRTPAGFKPKPARIIPLKTL